jgi:hypothetical protein
MNIAEIEMQLPARLRRFRQVARTGYWMMTPHKNPARIAFIRQLAANNERLLGLNAELAAKTEQLSERSADLAAKTEQLGQRNAELAAKTEQLNQQNAALAAKTEQLSQHNAELAATTEQLGQHNAEFAAKIEQLIQQNAGLAAKVEQLGQHNAEFAAKAERLNEQNAERVARIEQLSKHCGLDRPLAFMHVPKTAGAALTHSLIEALPATVCVNCYDRGFFGALGSCEIILPPADHAVFDALPAADEVIDFVAGHITYSTLVQGRPAARLMTVLREPRSRILSLWTFYRSQSDETVSRLAGFGRVVRLARQPLVEFLNHPEAACHTDNKYVRMLLWPHPLIPDDGFIDEASDERLVCEAAARLRAFEFADVIENPRLEDNVRAFLVRPFVYRRENESPRLPAELRVAPEQELTGEALHLVAHRSRLDRELWRTLAAERIAGADPIVLGDDTFGRTITRHAALMRPE